MSDAPRSSALHGGDTNDLENQPTEAITVQPSTEKPATAPAASAEEIDAQAISAEAISASAGRLDPEGTEPGSEPDDVVAGSDDLGSAERVFSPARALEAIGDRWGLLLFRDALFLGIRSFPDFERHVGITPDIVSARIAGFIGAGLMEQGSQDGEYVLTEKGFNLEPVIVALIAWADGWVGPEAGPAVLSHEESIERALRLAMLGSEGPDETVEEAAIELSLLGTFGVRVAGKPVDALSIGSQRLLVFLALHDRSVARTIVAGTMWPESSQDRAGLSLRSALSRLETSARDAILVAASGLGLADSVTVDLRIAQSLARRLLDPGASARDSDLSPAAVATLSLELLPDWYDEWIVDDAEDWRQLRMSALEAAATRLLDRGRLAEAAGAARAAIRAEPLRETAHARLISVHIAEGNQTEALRVYDRYRAHLSDALDLEPTKHLTELVQGIRD
ncbi:BTAD domain-containing putative transcriptional regulator [Marisediminicola senii]|uniref:BTAD domain-containing putative transcriptional regulator n=1 Tax=Marisediminicola senii TaxID=2711233 RepID=UPI0013E9C564|nr:BTAD domain-containing putative transcriptional regulator [Marisediminicola senii]